MDSISNKGYKTVLIDRTLPELYKINRNIKRLDALHFCWILNSVGIDIIEVDETVVNSINKLPTGINFLFRVENQHDFEYSREFNLSNLIVNKNMITLFNSETISKHNLDLTLEIELNNIDEILAILKDEKFLLSKNLLNKLRFTGLTANLPLNWPESLSNFISKYNLKIDICPRNKLFNATSTAVEAMLANFHSVTMTFLGIGKNDGFAPLEEVIIAYKIINNSHNQINLSTFQELATLYTKLTKKKIETNKAIVGTNIFNYESGIHASGIEKISNTYEPYEPQLVGLKRNLKIGKHSGTASIKRKLNDLGLNYNAGIKINKLLKDIRNKSTYLQRDLDDNEMIELYINNCL